MTGGYKKKLIEVALPLQAINLESKRDKNLSSGHPTTLHYWWAPRPLAACRAVVFASLVDDPSANPDKFPTEETQEAERQRLFRLLEKVILWESRNDRAVLEAARKEITKSTGRETPILYDPFCGRGLIPLEGQRLGLDVLASDLNPVPTTIAKTLLEIVPKFLTHKPVNPRSRKQAKSFGMCVAEGFIEDVEYYAERVLELSRPTLEPFFPKYAVSAETAASRPDLKGLVGKKITVMGWLWARTVKCSNPACGCQIPLVGSFWLSQKSGRKYWLEPVVDQAAKKITFRIGHGNGEAPPPTKLPNTGGTFKCPACKEDSDDTYVEQEGSAGRIGAQLMAIIADGGRSMGRVYLPATAEHERIALSAKPPWRPDMPMPDYSQAMPTAQHGVLVWADLFTNRQLLTLCTLSEQVRAIHAEAKRDAVAAGLAAEKKTLDDDGMGAHAYADGVATFLALILGKQTNRTCAFNFWDNGSEKVQQPFAQQGIQKTWDYVEGNLFCQSSGSWLKAVEYPVKVVKEVYPDIKPGRVIRQQVADAAKIGQKVIVVTDPPYYDNMGYADLSDFFYIWLRRALKDIYPEMFSTVLTPKVEELAAVRHRFGGDRKKAEAFFVSGFQDAFRDLAGIQHDDYPMCVFYAYKQKETRKGEMEASTGWETMLRGLIDAGLCITGTWPMLSESTDTIKKSRGSLSTSIVLVCRKRPANASVVSKGQFLAALRKELPVVLRRLQRSNIPPVDFDQAAIGPGMEIFSRYSRVIEPDGQAVSVRSALGFINQIKDEALGEAESDYDRETRWAIGWYASQGFKEGEFGVANTMAVTYALSVDGVEEAGIAVHKGSKVRLLRKDELPEEWDPTTDTRLTIWAITHHLLRVFEKQGESGAAGLLRKVGSRADAVHGLVYRLFGLSEKLKVVQEALAYDAIVRSWPEISRLAREAERPSAEQGRLFEQE
jgi:putative DNA methylase